MADPVHDNVEKNVEDEKNVAAPTAQQEDAAHEPVESAKAAEDIATVSIGASLFTFIALSALTLFVVATPLTWFSRRVPDDTVAVSLWKITNTTSYALEAPKYQYVLDMTCEDRRSRFRAIEAFAILSIGITFAMFMCGILARFAGKTLLGAKITSVIAFITSLITWAMAVALFYKSELCPGDASYSGDKYEFDVGVGLFVTGWVLTFIAFVVAAVDPRVPKVLPDVLLNKVLLGIFTVTQIVAFIFAVVGTPTQWFYRWENTSTVHRFTIWTMKTYTNDVLVSETDLKDVDCNEFAKIAKFAQAFTIMSIVATLVSAVVSALAAKGTLAMKSSIIAGFASLATTLITFAAGLTLFFRQYCSTPSLDQQRYIMTGGFVIFGCAFVMTAIGLIVLIIVSIAQLLVAEKAKPEGNVRWTAFFFLACTGSALFLQVVAADQPLFGKMQDDFNWVRYTFWRIYVKVNGAASNQDFGCTAIEQRLVGAGALNIISIVVMFVALVIGIAQLTNAALRKAATIVCMIANVILLISWALVAAVYTLEYCGNTFESSNYEVLQGFGFLLAAWIVTMLGSLLNWTNLSDQESFLPEAAPATATVEEVPVAAAEDAATA